MRIVDLDRGHPERPGRLQVAPDVVEEDHLRGRDPEAAVSVFAPDARAEIMTGKVIEGRDSIGRALGRAPRRVVVFGVEGAAFGMGDPVTADVEAALDGVAESVLAELEEGEDDA